MKKKKKKKATLEKAREKNCLKLNLRVRANRNSADALYGYQSLFP